MSTEPCAVVGCDRWVRGGHETTCSLHRTDGSRPSVSEQLAALKPTFTPVGPGWRVITCDDSGVAVGAERHNEHSVLTMHGWLTHTKGYIPPNRPAAWITEPAAMTETGVEPIGNWLMVVGPGERWPEECDHCDKSLGQDDEADLL